MLSSLAGGCAVSPVDLSAPSDRAPEYADCLSLFEENDEIIKHAGVRDAQNTGVRGFPYLRTNRFLSSLRDQLTTVAKRETWVEHLAELDLEGRQIENHNLPLDLRPSAEKTEAIERCRRVLVDEARSNPETFEKIYNRAVVADSYKLWARALGLYPLASLFVLHGVERFQTDEGRYFTDAAPRIDHREKYLAYGPAATTPDDEHYNIVRHAPRDAIGIPRIEPRNLKVLFAQHSPIWSVASRSPEDRIGTVAYEVERITIQTKFPAVYTHLSYTKFDGDILIQLNYTVWFPARPADGAFDILSGAIDGITWRVTLDPMGRFLFADAMHNCGCYYMTFPSPRIRPRNRSRGHEEPLWIPQTLAPKKHARAVIQISESAHYIRKVEFVSEPPLDFEILPVAYNALRSLPKKQHRYQSLFSPSGLVKGSERAERWLLWPMGIASAGAMRQFGHHAIAFVGRRHFDDPDLFDANFERAGP